MTQLIWQKAQEQVDPDVQQFLAGRDVELDRHLFAYDVEASIAHVEGLARIAAIDHDEKQRLVEALHTLQDESRRGVFQLTDEHEDGHSAIESVLTERLGETGKRVHLGRSRNDQVLVATRLFMRAMLDEISESAIAIARMCLDLARRDEHTPMPGYTHLQRAVPSTIGMWMAGFAEASIDDAELLRLTRRWMNACPLGTAAGYGVNLPLDRAYVSDALGFDRVLVNPMCAQNSRGKHEHQALASCWQVMQTVRRLAWDLSLFSTSEFGFLQIGNTASTGSSIMPNKRNPDLVELLRAAGAVVGGSMTELQQVLSLPSGYHRDLQLTKEPIVRGLLYTRDAVKLVPTLLESIELDRDAMKAAIGRDMFSTDRAVELALAGMPFREAYQQVGRSLRDDASTSMTAEDSIAARTSPGACADLRLGQIEERINSIA